MSDTYDLSNPLKPKIVKDPNAVLDYTFDWTEWLDGVADTLADKAITADAGITVVTSSIVGKKVVVVLSGGTVGTTYKVTCRITTAAVPARIDDRTIYVKIKER